MPKKIKATEVPGLLHPGMTVYVQGGANEPTEIMEVVKAQPDASDAVRYIQMFIPGVNNGDYSSFHPNAKATTFFVTAPMRESWKAGKVDFYPFHLHADYRFLCAMDPVDLLVLQLSPPDKHGNCSLGPTTDYVPAVLGKAKAILAEINPNVPYTYGGPRVPYERLDYVVETAHELVLTPDNPLNDDTKRIGKLVAELIEDGDTIQIGIGNVPNAILAELHGKRDLGFHSGLMTDACVDLIEGGAMNGARKRIDNGVHVTGIAVGTRKVFDFINNNATIHFREVGYTHEQETLRHLDCFISLNSVLEMDLLAQGNAEWIGTEQHGGIGGQGDFVRGARNSRGGKSVLAFLSTGRRGTISRIIPRLPHGAVVTTPRSDVDYVVTENGVAHVRDMTVDQRAEALIGLAAEQFRAELAQEWEKMRAAM